MIFKGRKCICKKCEDCNFYLYWDMAEIKNGMPTGLTERRQKCGFFALFETIPELRGSIDGCQAAVNETRNRVMEYGQASVSAIQKMALAAPDFARTMISGNREDA